MIWELMDTGHLPFWDWLWFIGTWLVVLVGIGAIVVIWRTRPPK